MFDWNDEEIGNMTWSVSDENGDHVVPRRDSNKDDFKKQWSRGASKVKFIQQKIPELDVTFHERNLEDGPYFYPIEETYAASAAASGINSRPFVPSFSATESIQASLDDSFSNSLSDIAIFDSSVTEMPQLYEESRAFQNSFGFFSPQHDFLDCSWEQRESFESFDDANQLFSIEYPLMGGENHHDHANDLLRASEELINSQENPFPLYVGSPSFRFGALRNEYDHLEIEMHNAQFNQPLVPDFEETNGYMIMDHANCIDNRRDLHVKNQMDDKKELTNKQKIEEKDESETFHEIPANWCSVQSPTSLHGCSIPSANANPINKLGESVVKPVMMTPRQKIDKLRRRQHVQAVAAIQEQLQQLIPDARSTVQKVPQYDPAVENSQAEPVHLHGALLSVEEEDDAVSTTFCQLRDIISKLDVGIRQCIRGSLFRLAQNATQRNYVRHAGSTNIGCRKEQTNSHHRNGIVDEMEAKTNQMDRTVAHLLFCRPQEPSSTFVCDLVPCNQKVSSK